MKKIFKLIFAIISIYILIYSIYLYFLEPAFESKSNQNNQYYIKFGYVKDAAAFQLDENNVTYVDYSKMKSMGVDNTISYYPVSIGLSGLRFLQQKNDTLFLAQANWLLNNIHENGAWYILHDKRIGKHKLKTPWISALSQGLGISVLVRAYKLTGNDMYLKTARKALKPFEKYIKDGGIVSKNNFGDFYEEYPIQERPTHVLNGFIYSLFGLYDLYKFDNNVKAKELFDKGIKTLKRVLPRYDLRNWTRYDLNKERTLKNHYGYASIWYQKLHVAQLYGLYKITGDKYFLDYSKKFEEQAKYSIVNFVIYPAYILYTDFVLAYRWIKGK
jgi:heparosan-N-sulfate-glucuronate 5-epimerase